MISAVYSTKQQLDKMTILWVGVGILVWGANHTLDFIEVLKQEIATLKEEVEKFKKGPGSS